MLTPKTLACAFLLGSLAVAVLACLVGEWLGVVFARETARALIGVRPI
jgi:hypothetical protein